MLDALQIASTGLTTASQRFDRAARDIAEIGVSTQGAELPPAAQVDLSSTALDLIGSEAAFALNAAVLRAADRMTGRILDIAA